MTGQLLKVILPEPAKPGDTVFMKSDFETKLPSRIRRTGYNDDFYFVAQWFPKFGVYEPARNEIFDQRSLELPPVSFKF